MEQALDSRAKSLVAERELQVIIKSELKTYVRTTIKNKFLNKETTAPESTPDLEKQINEITLILNSYQKKSNDALLDKKFSYVKLEGLKEQLYLIVSCKYVAKKNKYYLRIRFSDAFLDFNEAFCTFSIEDRDYKKIISIIHYVFSRDFSDSCNEQIQKTIDECYLNPRMRTIAFASLNALYQKYLGNQEKYRLVEYEYLSLIVENESKILDLILHKKVIEEVFAVEKKMQKLQKRCLKNAS